jgi:hypothetical protein
MCFGCELFLFFFGEMEPLPELLATAEAQLRNCGEFSNATAVVLFAMDLSDNYWMGKTGNTRYMTVFGATLKQELGLVPAKEHMNHDNTIHQEIRKFLVDCIKGKPGCVEVRLFLKLLP